MNSILNLGPLQRTLLLTIVLTLSIGFGTTSFINITDSLKDLEEVEQAKIDLLFSAIESDIRQDMLSYNAEIVIHRLHNIQESSKEIAVVRMFRNSGEEAFLNNKTIDSVNKFRGDEIFPRRKISDSIELKKINSDELNIIMQTKKQLAYKEEVGGQPVYTRLIPIIRDDRCLLCHGYEDKLVRCILQISVPRTALNHAKQDSIVRGVISAIFLIIFASSVMSLLIHKSVVKPVSEVTYQISSATAQQDRITTQQASSINEITTTIEELSATSKQVYSKAESLANQSKDTLTVAYEGQNAIEESISEMNLIKSKVQAIAEEVLALSENTNQIGAIINVVEDIANKTDMLALNASIEAAKAGDHGKGFAVVASEVRSLSDQSKKATEKVTSLIQEIQSSVTSTVMATEEGSRKVDAGVSHILNAGNTITNAINTMKATVEATKEIAIASHQGSLANEQVADTMIHINNGMKETTKANRESFMVVQKLINMIEKRKVLRPDIRPQSSSSDNDNV